MTSLSPRRPRVLIADDHAELAKAVSRLLTLECDVVGISADGHALLEAAARLRPDVVVLDLSLPHVKGLDACRQIKGASPDTRVVVFTAVDDPYVRQRAFDVGASGFVCKLTSDGDLLSTIKRVCANVSEREVDR